MERTNQFGLYELGMALQKLKTLKGDTSPHDAFWPLMGASSALGKLRKGDPIPISISEGRTKDLEESVDGLINEFYYVEDENGGRRFKWPEASGPKIEGYRFSSIVTELERFEIVFAEDMRENATYYVPRRGIYFTKALVDSADESFPKGIIESIPEKARVEWRAAGRCLAFNLLSASGFHVARAVEAVLEQYYQYFCAKGPDDTLAGWKDYVDALEKAKGPALPDAKTLAELKQMKDDYRNPVMHPRAVLSEPNARMLFNNGESLIIAMVQDLCVARAKEPEPQTNFLGLINSAPEAANEEAKAQEA